MGNAFSAGKPRVVIVGGGLAGLAAAVRLVEQGCQVELFEARRRLGGRAGSYVDRETGELIDHCQHVAMGCCTNFLDFCRRTEIFGLLERHRELYFMGPDSRVSTFRLTSWLPAPLHLAPAFLGLRYLSLADKLSIARAMRELIATPVGDPSGSESALSWLRRQRQSDRAIEFFWKVILISALAVSLEKATLAAIRQVFVEGFLGHPDACELYLPRASLGEFYDDRVAGWLRQRGVTIHLEASVQGLSLQNGLVAAVMERDRHVPCDFCVIAVPWRRASQLLAGAQEPIPNVDRLAELESSPITSVHLWYDRAIMSLPHAVMVGRLSQWIFARRLQQTDEQYYQVVISASGEWEQWDREQLVQRVIGELVEAFPAAAAGKLVRWQVVTDPHAVFVPSATVESIRPAQQTRIANLMLAGDWTATGWPATMEGAVRSGYLAAEAVLSRLGRPAQLLTPAVPGGRLMRAMEG